MAVYPHSLVDVETRAVGDSIEIVVRGEIDIASIAHIAAPVRDALSKRPARLIIDLEAVDFLDSICIRLLIKTTGMAKTAGVETILKAPTGLARRALEIVGIQFMLGDAPEPQFRPEAKAKAERALKAVIDRRRKLERRPGTTTPSAT